MPEHDTAVDTLRRSVHHMSGDIMIITAAAAVGATAGVWLVAPFVAMARTGTLDDRARAAAASAVGTIRATAVPEVSIPAQRRTSPAVLRVS